MTRQVSLWVNDECIELDYFVSGFIDHTVVGMLGALRGTGEVGSLELSIADGGVSINLNNTQVPANEFVSKIIKNTVTGMVSSLKGVGKIKSIKIGIQR